MLWHIRCAKSLAGRHAAQLGAFKHTNRLRAPLMCSRLMLLMVEGQPWSPAVHNWFPPAFKAAARALLLAHHRGAGSSQQAARRARKGAGEVQQQVRIL